MKLKTAMSRVWVQSLANGEMLVHPTYKAKPLEKGATPVGVLTRLAVAEEIERILNRECKGRAGV